MKKVIILFLLTAFFLSLNASDEDISIGNGSSSSSNTNGSNGSIMYRNNEENLNNSPLIPYWFDDVRIDPRNGIRETSLVSLSNGELYCISRYLDSGNWNILIRRSIDGGVTWTTFWDYEFTTGTLITCPRIVECHDSLIVSYILSKNSVYWTNVRVTTPGNTYNEVYWGNPSGVSYSNITDLRICTNGATFINSQVYATWAERYGITDSTRVMFARSHNTDISTWELGPIILAKSTIGFFDGTRIAHGQSGKLWIVAHFCTFLAGHDDNIRGWYSYNFGSSWGGTTQITPYSNGIHEYQPSIAGSHINNNWVLLTTVSDTGSTDKDIRLYYSTDNGTNWTNINWFAAHKNYLPDVWVDDNSTAFFGVCRRDLTSTEEVLYKKGNIADPTSWSGFSGINDDDSNLSNSFGPSVAYNYATGDAIIAWTNYNSNIYSIWFDDENWSTGIEEENPSDIGNSTEIMNIVGNPSHRNIDIRYTITIPGNVKITLHDVSGRTVSEFVNAFKEAGSYELNLEPNISSGVYYITINSLEGSGTKQVLFIQ